MSGHTFGARLYLLRERVMRWSRERLAKKLRERASRLPLDDAGDLPAITRDDIREWEEGRIEPSYVTRRILAQVLRIQHEILDPDESTGGLSPQGLLSLARAKGLSPDEISYYWQLTRHRALFQGNPSAGEWVSIIEQMAGATPAPRQRELFEGGAWCTHCGNWVSRDITACPECGSAE